MMLLIFVLLFSSTFSLLAEWDFQNLKENESVIVKFYADWCSACKIFAPEWDKVQESLTYSNVQTKRVNCEENKNICQYYNIQSYPTVKLYRSGKESTYSGERKVELITQWAKTMIPHKPITVRDLNDEISLDINNENVNISWEELEKDQNIIVIDSTKLGSIGEGKWLLIFHIGSKFDKEFIPTIKTIAEAYGKHLQIGVANVLNEEELIKDLGLTGFPSLLFLKDGVESIPSFYEGHIKKLDNIKNWLDSHLKEGNKEEL